MGHLMPHWASSDLLLVECLDAVQQPAILDAIAKFLGVGPFPGRDEGYGSPTGSPESSRDTDQLDLHTLIRWPASIEEMAHAYFASDADLLQLLMRKFGGN